MSDSSTPSTLNFSLFSEAITVLKEVGNGVIFLSSLPAKQRDSYRTIVDDTFTLLDHSILIVTQRLADCLLVRKEHGDVNFMDEINKLQYVSEWENVERDVRLCRSLRIASDEMRHLFSQVGSKLSLTDSGRFWDLVNLVLEGEVSLAHQISTMFTKLSQVTDADSAADELSKYLIELRFVRRDLISSQVAMLDFI